MSQTHEFVYNVGLVTLAKTKGLIIVGPAPIAPVPFWVPNELDS